MVLWKITISFQHIKVSLPNLSNYKMASQQLTILQTRPLITDLGINPPPSYLKQASLDHQRTYCTLKEAFSITVQALPFYQLLIALRNARHVTVLGHVFMCTLLRYILSPIVSTFSYTKMSHSELKNRRKEHQISSPQRTRSLNVSALVMLMSGCHVTCFKTRRKRKKESLGGLTEITTSLVYFPEY